MEADGPGGDHPTDKKSLASQFRSRLFLRYGNLVHLQLTAAIVVVAAVSLSFAMAPVSRSILIGEDSVLMNPGTHIDNPGMYHIGNGGFILCGLLLGAGFVIKSSLPFSYRKRVNIGLVALISLYCVLPGIGHLLGFTLEELKLFMEIFGRQFIDLFVVGLFLAYCMPVAAGILGVFTHRQGYSVMAGIIMLLMVYDAGGDVSDGFRLLHFLSAAIAILIFLEMSTAIHSFSEYAGRLGNMEKGCGEGDVFKDAPVSEAEFTAFDEAIRRRLHWDLLAAAALVPLILVFANAHHLMTLLDSGQLRDSLEVRYLYGRVVAAYVLLFSIGVVHMFLMKEMKNKAPRPARLPGKQSAASLAGSVPGETLSGPYGAGSPVSSFPGGDTMPVEGRMHPGDALPSREELEFRKIFGN